MGKANKVRVNGLVMGAVPHARLKAIRAEILISHFKKKNYTPPDELNFQELNAQLQEAFYQYAGRTVAQSTTNTRVILTHKELQAEIKKIRTAAQKLLEKQTPEWANKLYKYISPHNADSTQAVRVNIHKRLQYAGHDINDLKSHLNIIRYPVSGLREKSPDSPLADILNILIEDDQAYYSRLTALHGKEYANIYGELVLHKQMQERDTPSIAWPQDPFLLPFIEVTSDIWTQLTGRSLRRISTDATGDEKASCYELWINRHLGKLNCPTIRYWAIVNVVDFIEQEKIS